MSRFFWSQSSVARAVELALESNSIDEAVAKCTGEFGITITRNAIDTAFNRYGLETLYAHIVRGMAARAKGVPAPTPSTPKIAPPEQGTPFDHPTYPHVRVPTEEEIEQARILEDAHDRERHAFQEQIRELASKNKRLLEQLAERDAMLGIADELHRAPPRPVVAPKGRGEGKRRLGVPVMLLSDWHVEEPVDPRKVNGLNEYNLDIADRCIDRCAEAFDWLTRDPRYEMREAVIWLGGDLMSGHIHQELVEQNFLSPVQAGVWLQDRIERMLRAILATTEFERLIVPCNDGNHGRLTDKVRVATRTENSIEWFVYKNLEQRFRDEPRVEFHVADGEYQFLDVYDQTICFFHGDSVRYQGGVGGLLIPMKKHVSRLRLYRDVDQFCFGHFHQRIDVQGLNGNGSMIGISPYGMRIAAEPEPRQQSFFVIDSERGKCLSAPVWL